jgi:hypothetical protein
MQATLFRALPPRSSCKGRGTVFRGCRDYHGVYGWFGSITVPENGST